LVLPINHLKNQNLKKSDSLFDFHKNQLVFDQFFNPWLGALAGVGFGFESSQFLPLLERQVPWRSPSRQFSCVATSDPASKRSIRVSRPAFGLDRASCVFHDRFSSAPC
jgi:hypothetical protein